MLLVCIQLMGPDGEKREKDLLGSERSYHHLSRPQFDNLRQ